MKTVCIYHSVDLDGWMSAAIVKHWHESQPDYLVDSYKRHDGEYSLDFLGYNYGDPIPNLSSYDRVIMCDVSFPVEEMRNLFHKLKVHFIWIDHHISAISDMKTHPKSAIYPEGLRNIRYAACELTWQHLFPNNPMPEIVRLLGRYDCFGHKGTDEERKVLEFQYGARSIIGSYKSAYSYLVSSSAHDEDIDNILEIGKSIYAYLCTEAKQIYKNRFSIYFGEYAFCAINKERFNPINFGIKYHDDKANDNYYYDGVACFHYDGELWKFSLYNDNGEVDVSVIAKQYDGGGHKGAAGFTLKNIGHFIKNHTLG